jgi:hypothetical protein
MRRAVAVVALLILVLPAVAHEVRPGYLELIETEPGVFSVTWKIPLYRGAPLPIRPILPPNARPASPVTQRNTGDAEIRQWAIKVEGGFGGQTIAIQNLDVTITDVLMRLQVFDGATFTHRFTPNNAELVVPDRPAGLGMAISYAGLGIEHIILGVDHLLFVLGLLLIVRDRWMLLKTVTSFTIAHSITLAIATLGYASAPVEPLNVAIALCILFLGPEVERVRRGDTSLTIRHPWMVAFVFGLLHGFGFASGLTTLGLPQNAIPVALLFFNVGVEIGQVFFVVIIILIERSFIVLEMRWPRWAALAPGYTVGGLGAYWTIQRAAMMFGVI